MSDFVNTRATLGEQETLDALIANTLTELKEDGTNTIGQRALWKNQGLTLVAFPSVTSTGQYALAECAGLRSASFAALTSTASYLFSGCAALETVDFPLLESIGQYTFQNCRGLKVLSFPRVKTINSYAFDGCTGVTSVSFPEATSVQQYAFKNVPVWKLALPKATNLGTYLNNGNGAAEVDLSAKPSIPSNAFYGAYNMTSLVLRNPAQLTLSATSAFTNTPIANGYGWIYVPAELVDTYRAASNWSTYASQIVPLDNYPLEVAGTIKNTWEEIFAAEDDGTYATKYSVGDTKFVKINGIPVCMQIAAIDGDELADGSGNAKITWLCKGYQGTHNMNGTNVTTNGWAGSAMRQYLIDSILPNIDSTVKNRIKAVNKTYYDATSSSTKTSVDSIWIPSYREVGFGTNESSGVIYSGLFSDAASRIKYASCTTASASAWWLRSAYGSASFCFVNFNGSSGGNGASSSYGVVFGFCT